MKKILLSVSVIAVVAAVVIGVTTAFFSDTETSTGNTFTAGSLDLTIDSTQHYNGNVCVANATGASPAYIWSGNASYPVAGTACDGTWLPANLGAQKFFNFTDIKPGDSGEDTISLHVDNNPAWLRLVINGIVDNEGTPKCTEPELAIDTCETDQFGELRSQLLFTIFTDENCNNIKDGNDAYLISAGPINLEGETWILPTSLPGDRTVCFGVTWSLPGTVGNNAQTDTFGFNATFQVQQVRNNPTPTW